MEKAWRQTTINALSTVKAIKHQTEFEIDLQDYYARREYDPEIGEWCVR